MTLIQAKLVIRRLEEIFEDRDISKIEHDIMLEIMQAVEQGKCFMIRKINDKEFLLTVEKE